jgi:hypothetical protein
MKMVASIDSDPETTDAGTTMTESPWKEVTSLREMHLPVEAAVAAEEAEVATTPIVRQETTRLLKSDLPDPRDNTISQEKAIITDVDIMTTLRTEVVVAATMGPGPAMIMTFLQDAEDAVASMAKTDTPEMSTDQLEVVEPHRVNLEIAHQEAMVVLPYFEEPLVVVSEEAKVEGLLTCRVSPMVKSRIDLQDVISDIMRMIVVKDHLVVASEVATMDRDSNLMVKTDRITNLEAAIAVAEEATMPKRDLTSREEAASEVAEVGSKNVKIDLPEVAT